MWIKTDNTRPTTWLLHCLLLHCLLLTTLLSTGCSSTGQRQESESAQTTASGLSAKQQRRYRTALDELAKGEFERAEALLSTLGEDNGQYAALWINLANARYQAGKLDTALDALKRAEAVEAQIADIHNLRGLIAMERGQYQAAEKHYLAALAINTDHANSHYNLGLLYDLFLQNLPLALEHYSRYLELGNTNDAATANWVEQIRRSLQQERQS